MPRLSIVGICGLQTGAEISLPIDHAHHCFEQQIYMKNRHYEYLGRRMREYHRANPWNLSEGGLYIPHAYTEMGPQSLSFWDDVGFVLNGRRIMVWWQHPRDVYMGAIESSALQEAGDDPGEDWLCKGGAQYDSKARKSGKHIRAALYISREMSAEQRHYYDRVNQIEERLSREGIDHRVSPSWKWERLDWAMGVSLVAPLEVRCETELAQVARLARALILQETTLAREFPEYVYDQESWLRDQAILAAQEPIPIA